MKICIKCGLEKDTDEFRQGKNTCLICMRLQMKVYKSTNKGKIKEINKVYYENNKDIISHNQAQDRKNNSEKYKLRNRNYYENNKSIILVKQNDYYKKTKIVRSKINKLYRIKNKKQLNVKNTIRIRRRRQIDLAFRLRGIVSNSIGCALKRNGSSKNGSSIINHLPYSIEELKKHLEQQFESWMTWQNWGKYDPKTWKEDDINTWTWQIDHIIPQSSFDFTNDEEIKKCWALSNLRPYSAKSNVIEGSRKANG